MYVRVPMNDNNECNMWIITIIVLDNSLKRFNNYDP
jgi:hypothetical protein